MSADVEVNGIDEAIALLQRIEPALETALTGVAVEVQDRVSVYPPQRRKKMRFTSAKQRRGFFAKLRSGAIQVPYRRGSSPGSQTLGRKWRLVQEAKRVRVRNTAKYAPLVLSSEKQAGYHRGNWKTDKDVAEQVVADGTAVRIIEQSLKQALGD